jgi:hypothetical protein
MLSPATRERLQDVIIRWGAALLADPQTTRLQMAELAQALTRVPSDRILDALAGLLAEDMKRLTAEYSEAAAARAAGRAPSSNAVMRWHTQYARALMAIGNDRAVEVTRTYLEHPLFAVDAANVLAYIANGPEPRDENRPIRSGPDFEAARENFAKRQSGGFRDTHPFVDLVFAAARNVAASGAPRDVERSLQLAAVALRMPYANKRAEIAWFLALDAPPIQKQRLLVSMAVAGEVVPLDLLNAGLDRLLSDVERDRWMQDEREGWRYREWLQLVPFSGSPEALLPMLDRIPARRLSADHVHGFIGALGLSPFARAEDVLVEIARRNTDMFSDYQWLSAVARRGTESMGMRLLELLDVAAGADDRGHRMELHRELASLCRKHRQVREAVHARFAHEAPGRARAILERAIADDHSEEGVIVLLRASASETTEMRNTALREALQDVLVDQRPSSSFRGMQEMYALPAGHLRRTLFDIILSGSAAEAALATACLDEIDEIRDRYGATDSDRRHPHIQSGVPWPRI